jgi:hypothetical protein
MTNSQVQHRPRVVAMSLARYLAHRARVGIGPPNNGMQQTALRAAADAER